MFIKKQWIFFTVVVACLFVVTACGNKDKSSGDVDADSYQGPPADFSKPTFLFVLRPHRENEGDYPWAERRDDSLLDGSYFSRIVVKTADGDEEEILSQPMLAGVGEYYVSRDIPFHTVQEEPDYIGQRDLRMELYDSDNSLVASFDFPMGWSEDSDCDHGLYKQVFPVFPITIDFGTDRETEIWTIAEYVASFSSFAATFNDDVSEERIYEVVEEAWPDP